MEVAAVSHPGPLTLSPSLVYVAYISPSLPGDRPYDWMWYKFCAASDPTEMSAHLARWQQGGGEGEGEGGRLPNRLHGGREEKRESGRSLGSLHLCRACSAPT